MSKRFHNVGQMIFHLALRHAEKLGQLVRRQQGAGQQRHDSLPGRLLWSDHAGMIVGEPPTDEKAGMSDRDLAILRETACAFAQGKTPL